MSDIDEQIAIWAEGDSSYNMPDVPNSAVTGGMQQTGSSWGISNQWTGFFQDIAKSGLGYLTKKDAAQTQLQLRQQNGMSQAQIQAINLRNQNTSLLPYLLIGGVVLLLMKTAQD